MEEKGGLIKGAELPVNGVVHGGKLVSNNVPAQELPVGVHGRHWKGVRCWGGGGDFKGRSGEGAEGGFLLQQGRASRKKCTA